MVHAQIINKIIIQRWYLADRIHQPTWRQLGSLDVEPREELLGGLELLHSDEPVRKVANQNMNNILLCAKFTHICNFLNNATMTS